VFWLALQVKKLFKVQCVDFTLVELDQQGKVDLAGWLSSVELRVIELRAELNKVSPDDAL